jgi:hypothetical protein
MKQKTITPPCKLNGRSLIVDATTYSCHEFTLLANFKLQDTEMTKKSIVVLIKK